MFKWFWTLFSLGAPDKHSGTFANRKYEEPILVTLLKMRPRYGHSTRENAAPSSGTSPLVSLI